MLSDYLDTEFAILDRVSVPDSFGGVTYSYREGAHFFGGVVKNTTTEMQIAEQSGAKSVYTLVVDLKIVLERGQYVRRLSDAADFRITAPTRDMTAPKVSSLRFAQASMERVEL